MINRSLSHSCFFPRVLFLVAILSLLQATVIHAEMSELDTISSALQHLTKGTRYLQEGQYETAVEEFRVVVELRPEMYSGHFFLGQTLLRQGNFAEAEKSLRVAVRLEPEDEDSRAYLVIALAAQGLLKEAEEHMKHAFSQNENSETVVYAKGLLELIKGNYDEAEKWFKGVLEINPNNEHARRAIAEIEEERKKLAKPVQPKLPSQLPTRTGWIQWMIGIPIYVVGAFVAQMLIGVILNLLNLFGMGFVALPGAGANWMAKKFGWHGSERVEKWNTAFYVATWGGPIYLVTQLVLIAVQAMAISLFTGLMMAWLPAVAVAFRIMGWIWMYTAIGVSGLIAFAIIAWVLKVWLGTLGIFWALFYSLF